MNPFTTMEKIYVIMASVVPYTELRGAIPLAFYYGAKPWEAFFFGVLGNVLPVVPVMMILPVLARLADKVPIFHRLLAWLHSKATKHQDKVRKYGFWGLTTFVAIPLPMTGVWMGAVVAYIMEIPKRHAFFALTLGALIAGIIVTLLCTFGVLIFNH